MKKENFDHILLFKTDIKSKQDKQALQLTLDKNEHIEQWNVDMDDEDCVLRIISYQLSHKQIIELIKNQGYKCKKLK
ncbi:hypothetical protein H7F33_13860 [Pedobacter sp. PAMC26386]|nr:hypothetical protein H7F33_13860 [Pedobacter sp. PAMC26386]